MLGLNLSIHAVPQAPTSHVKAAASSGKGQCLRVGVDGQVKPDHDHFPIYNPNAIASGKNWALVAG